MLEAVTAVVDEQRSTHRFSKFPQASTDSRLVFPGSFNPLHDGHRRMAAIAGELTGHSVEFELSVRNVDKPKLTAAQVCLRLVQFDNWAPIWLTNAATFVEKSALFANAQFILGADTALRLFDRKYYEDTASLDAAMQALADQGCRFLVFGREVDGVFRDAGRLALPMNTKALFDLVPEAQFRADISSSELRRGEK